MNSNKRHNNSGEPDFKLIKAELVRVKKTLKNHKNYSRIREFLVSLCLHESTLLEYLEKGIDNNNGRKNNEGEVLLEEVVALISSLIDIASEAGNNAAIDITSLNRSAEAIAFEKVVKAKRSMQKIKTVAQTEPNIIKSPPAVDNELLMPLSPLPTQPIIAHNKNIYQYGTTTDTNSTYSTPNSTPTPTATPSPSLNNGMNAMNLNMNPNHLPVGQTTPKTNKILAGPPEIPPEEIIFDKYKDFLGGGAFGKVYKAKCRGKDVAVKVPLKQNLTESELRAFRHEVQIMRKIFHPNVVLFLGACTNPGNLMIVTELMATDLDHLIHPPVALYKQHISMYKKLHMLKDAVLGVNWLHGICRIIHRDMKPANLLVDKNSNVKVTDFGFSEILRDDRSMRDRRGPKGTALYMAPEVMRLKPFNEKADVYSFGLIFWELYTEREPFEEYDELESFFQAVCVENERPLIPDDCLPSFANLMERCWDVDPAKRPSLPEVLFYLNISIIESVMPDEVGREFWKDHFLGKEKDLQEEIMWREFEFLLAKSLNVHPTEISFLKQLIAVNTKNGTANVQNVVSLRHFSLCVRWFGQFFLPAYKIILIEIKELLAQSWFVGDVSKYTAEAWLRGRPDGTFLVRLSHSNPSQTPFTISKNKMGVSAHKRITRLNYDPYSKERFSTLVDSDIVKFETVVDVINTLASYGNLKEVCPQKELPNPYQM